MMQIVSLIENIVGNYLITSMKDAVVRSMLRGPDFEVRKQDGSRILIEVKGSLPRKDILLRLVQNILSLQEPADKFILVTPDPPTPNQKEIFQEVFSKIRIPCNWVGLQSLPDELGKPSPGDFSLPETIANLQLSSLIGNLEHYKKAPIGLGQVHPISNIAKELSPLSRQFSLQTLTDLSAKGRPIEECFRIAQRTENVTVVLSDIVNFSNLVVASRPEDLKESMGRYYRLARNAVFSHGGMLDKFIGDAVLAIFGYPLPGPHDAVNAIKFGQELVSIGNEVLNQWLNDLNAVINTGTRVGIATGHLWPINIGRDELEITLLGDTINLAARLEKNCEANKLLVDNRTKSKSIRENSDFIDTLRLKEILIQPSEAKGQQFPIRAWATNISLAG